MKMLKKTVALVMALALILCLVPLNAMASETEETAAEMPQMPAAQTEAAEAPEKTPETVAEESVQETAQLPELEPIQPGQVVEYIPTQVNPRYADLYTADDFDIPAFPSDTGDADIMATSNSLTKEEAAAQLRTKMTNRVGTVTLCVTGHIYNPEQTAYEIFEMALVHTGKPKEGDYLMWHWASWEAKITKGTGYDYIYEYALTYHTTYNQEYELDNYILTLTWQLNIRNASDYQKIKAVYEYMCKNITYDDTSSDDDMLKHTAYSALVKKKAVCQGYASLFYRIMLELGVDCRVIAGIGGGGAHGWNIVKLDGLYYNLDATWDAGTTDYTYFLGSMWEFLDHARYLEYETWEFHEQYPMAAEKYTAGEKGEMDPYIYVGVCGDEALFLMSRDGTLEIGGSGVTYDHVDSNIPGSGALWRYWVDHITSVIVHDGIIGIGQYNFDKIPNLTEVYLADSVATIGEYAFSECSALTLLEVGNGLKQIRSYAFFRCSGLKGLRLPESLTEIQSNAFAFCGALTELKLSESPTYIAPQAFYKCTALTKLEIPGTITYLSGFDSCTGLTKVTVCEGISRVESEAFTNCKALTEVYLPESLITIGNEAFSETRLRELVIPSGVTTIELDAFRNCWIRELVVPANVTSLNGFRHCSSLATVYLYNSGTIETGAFESTGVRMIVFGEQPIKIEDGAFRNCQSLYTLAIPENVTDLSGFSGCTSLKTVHMECTRINENAFDNCRCLQEIDFGSNLTYIGPEAFYNADALTEVTLPETLIEIDDYAFWGCGKLEKVNLPDSLKVIGSNVFQACQSLRDITIPAGVEKMMSSCFIYSLEFKTIRFRGDPPEFMPNTFELLAITAYYPSDNERWTDEVKQNYGGLSITWLPFDSKVDLNSDMNVDDADVEYLLWHTLFPDMYPIESDVDLNGDGLINDGDVEYLLWHILFPDMYPV